MPDNDIKMETRVKLLEEQTSRHESRLDRHSEKIDTLEEKSLKLPHEINASITEALKPVMDSMKDLVEENSKLQKELMSVKNEKYVEGYNSLKRGTWWLLGLIGTYVITIVLKLIFEK